MSINTDVATLDAPVTNRTVRKRVSSLKPSPENLELYRAIDTDDPPRVGTSNQYFIEGMRFPLDAYETRRLVWDETMLVPGTYGINGWFNADTAPRFVVTVGP